VIHNWKRNPVTRRDPLAAQFFSTLVVPATLFSILGTPLVLYSASHPGKTKELWFTADDCNKIRAEMAKLMGPTRTAESWKCNDYDLSHFSDATKLILHDPDELAVVFESLREANDAKAAGQKMVILDRVRKAWDRKEIDTWIAMDFETWEQDHDLVTEVGLSWVDRDGNRFHRHFGPFQSLFTGFELTPGKGRSHQGERFASKRTLRS
jgi:hypothetical protein